MVLHAGSAENSTWKIVASRTHRATGIASANARAGQGIELRPMNSVSVYEVCAMCQVCEPLPAASAR